MILFLDANVIYSIFLTDLFLTLHEEGFCTVHWSTYVEHEAEYHLSHLSHSGHSGHSGQHDPDKIRQRFDAMRAFAEIEDQRQRVRFESGRTPPLDIELPDADDIQVLEDAVASGAEWLVTFNLRDFPPRTLAPFGLQPSSPDQVLERLLAPDADELVQLIDRWRTDKRSPTLGRQDIVKSLRANKCDSAANLLTQAWVD